MVFDMPLPRQVSPDAFVKQPFDYIVIGGGTAGIAVACRLAERKHLQIGLIEAGRSIGNDENVNVPAIYGRSISGEIDWCHQTIPQAGLGGRKLLWPRGKALGGTSSINFMAWVRASRQDYDAWEALGNRGWGWDSLLPFFKKSETFHPPSETLATNFDVRHDASSLGTGGPIHISYNEEYSASHCLWHQTLNSVGIPTNVAHTAGSNVGVWTNISSVDPRTATRSYATSYLDSGSHAPNLHILTDAQVKRIILQSDGAKCTANGVVFQCGGLEFEALASREIVLSAGSVQSPQILELSGIGNPDILGDAGVKVHVKSPMVGENLQDHIMLATIFEVDPLLPNPDDLLVDNIYATKARQEYETRQSGPCTVLPCALCYVPLKEFVPQAVLADLKKRAQAHSAFSAAKSAIVVNRLGNDTNLGHVEYIFDLGNWSPSFKGEAGKKYGTMLQILQYPFSVGSIHIRPDGSRDDDESPATELHIDPRYYHGEHGKLDVEVMQQAFHFLEKIVTTKPLANIIRCRVAPAEDVKDGERMRHWIAQNTMTDWHPVGTCAMGGRAGISGGVVNERLQVYGVRSLRVIDANKRSYSTVYAIAEKGAAMILEDLDSGADDWLKS
ncbi:choline dehydrogenase, putative [Cordyceps militaris CM01]|uniref:Choline dehydrogenase, putative n=1 Tax=Cordyceps militaris (strain CM01) TaxID=983644 RepID=G3JT40_CORMM|nr:choline dehydrogenase, putative [Cordyceps militaris CM01]EGX89036.1 choline dehydrogenase, putative [Cordyceps militaris CM01]